MNRPNKVEALPGFRIRVGYPDGVEGVIDLSADVGRGMFAPLAGEKFFRTVHIGSFGQIAWTEEIELCPDAAYQEMTGKTATIARRPIQQARGFLRGWTQPSNAPSLIASSHRCRTGSRRKPTGCQNDRSASTACHV